VAITPPSGWTLVRRINNAATTANALAVYWRTAQAGEPSAHAWAIAGGAFLVGGIQAFSGVDTANPVDVENGQSTPSGTNHDTPSVTTSTANAMLVTAHTYASSDTWTPQAGLTEGFDRPSGAKSATGQSITGDYQLTAESGPASVVGNAHISQNGSDVVVMTLQAVQVKPLVPRPRYEAPPQNAAPLPPLEPPPD